MGWLLLTLIRGSEGGSIAGRGVAGGRRKGKAGKKRVDFEVSLQSVLPPKYILLGNCEPPPGRQESFEVQGCDVPRGDPQKPRGWHLRSQRGTQPDCPKEGKVKRRRLGVGSKEVQATSGSFSFTGSEFSVLVYDTVHY